MALRLPELPGRADPVSSPPRKRRDRALLLRRFPYGESSLLVHLLTPSSGRVNLLAKGAYRPRSGYSWVLDLFDTLELGWRESARSELGLLVSGTVARRRRGIPQDLPSYRAALGVLEVAGLGARPAHEETALFDLVETALDLLADRSGSPEIVETAFDLRFLALLGLAPALDECAACGADLSGKEPGTVDVPFSPASGGRLCAKCVLAARPSRPSTRARIGAAPLHTLRVARSLLSTPLPQLSRVRLDAQRSRRVRDLVQGFLAYHLESRPRSWETNVRPARAR